MSIGVVILLAPLIAPILLWTGEALGTSNRQAVVVYRNPCANLIFTRLEILALSCTIKDKKQ